MSTSDEARAAARAFAAVRAAAQPVETRAPWMSPGASSIRKPSWIRVQSFAESAPPSSPQPASKPSRPSMAAVAMPSTPPRSIRPSMLPPASSRFSSAGQGAAIIQSAREVELEAEVGALHAELARVADEAEHMRTRVMEESEPAMIALAVAIARRVVGRELATDPALIQHWIKESMGTLPAGAVYVAADVEPLEGQTIDAALPPSTAEIRSGASTVAVGAEPRVAALADALGVDS